MRIVDLFLKLDRKSDMSGNELEDLGKDLEHDTLLIKNDLQRPRIYEFSVFQDSSEDEKKNLDFTDVLIEKIKGFKKEFIDGFTSI